MTKTRCAICDRFFEQTMRHQNMCEACAVPPKLGTVTYAEKTVSTLLKAAYEEGAKHGFIHAQEVAAQVCERSHVSLSEEEFNNQTPTQARRLAAEAIRALKFTGAEDFMHVTSEQAPPVVPRT